ncbi:uncharacterized protein LOC121106795 [Gallus gallus]|uniref:uncharacterized protein LOC121106795 n=1 Tax=Gallus gallus TaxID=9031 RepID=UPI001EFF70F7|nr:uncharacterized protein LOC121106795 [Gallus gallus]
MEGPITCRWERSRAKPQHHRSKQILNFQAGKGESIFFLILLQLKHIGLILLLTVQVLKSVLHHHQFTDWKSGETPACCRGSAKEVQRETMHRGEEQMPSETEPCGSSLCCSSDPRRCLNSDAITDLLSWFLSECTRTLILATKNAKQSSIRQVTVKRRHICTAIERSKWDHNEQPNSNAVEGIAL